MGVESAELLTSDLLEEIGPPSSEATTLETSLDEVDEIAGESSAIKRVDLSRRTPPPPPRQSTMRPPPIPPTRLPPTKRPPALKRKSSVPPPLPQAKRPGPKKLQPEDSVSSYPPTVSVPADASSVAFADTIVPTHSAPPLMRTQTDNWIPIPPEYERPEGLVPANPDVVDHGMEDQEFGEFPGTWTASVEIPTSWGPSYRRGRGRWILAGLTVVAAGAALYWSGIWRSAEPQAPVASAPQQSEAGSAAVPVAQEPAPVVEQAAQEQAAAAQAAAAQAAREQAAPEQAAAEQAGVQAPVVEEQVAEEQVVEAPAPMRRVRRRGMRSNMRGKRAGMRSRAQIRRARVRRARARRARARRARGMRARGMR